MIVDQSVTLVDASTATEVPVKKELSTISSTVFQSRTKTINFADRAVEGGECYFSVNRISVGASATVNIGLNVTAVPNSVYLQLPQFSTYQTTIFIDANIAAVTSGGTPIPLFNCNGKNAPPEKLNPTTTMTLNPTVTFPGITFLSDALFSESGGPQAASSSALTGIDTFFKIDTSVNYLISFVNQTSTATTLAYKFFIIETD